MFKRIFGFLAWALLGAVFVSALEGGARTDTWEWSVTIDGQHYGVFDQKTGGEVDSDSAVYKPGGMAEEYGLGGSRTVSNVTLVRNYRLGRDHPKSQHLINSVGKKNATLVGQPLDEDGNAWGAPFTYNAKFKRVKFPDSDSMTTDPAMLELEFIVIGMPTGMDS